MRKIISLFQRNYGGDGLVRDEVVPGAEWALAGEGLATRKWDGTCCLIRGGQLFKRYDAKHGKAPPPAFEAAQDPDPITGHWPGWIPVGDGPEDQWHREAWDRLLPENRGDGTFELLGPKIGGNRDGWTFHVLVRHGTVIYRELACARTFALVRDFLSANDIEGVVFHHADGRMVKIKGRDFGFARGPRKRTDETD